MGEARNQCRRLCTADNGYNPTTAGISLHYVTPPINSYYRRLVHQMAESYGLQHESIPVPNGIVRKATSNIKKYGRPKIHRGQDWDIIHQEVLKTEKAVLITVTTDANTLSTIQKVAQIEAALKSPYYGSGLGWR